MNDRAIGAALEALCGAAGIVPGYSDVWGKTHTAPESTRRALLGAMGLIQDSTPPEEALEQYEAQTWRQMAPPVAVYREEAVPYRLLLRFPEAAAGENHGWRLALETGETRHGEFRPVDLERVGTREIGGTRYVQVAFDWRERLPLGYHRFIVQPRETAGSEAATTLIVAPQRCYLPPALREGARVWGAAAQLYGVRSGRNWGMGDFTDLASLVEQWGRRGAGIIGMNPLHALYPHNPAHASPYSPSSRRFLNVLYLDVEALPDMRECREARAKVRSAEFRARIKAARAGDLVDYRPVAALKLEVLQLLYAHFRRHNLDGNTEGARAFRDFQAAGGEALRRHALFEALQQHFHDADPNVWGFPVWPEAYRDPRSEEVARYAAANVERIEFYEYLQWHADAQLGNAAERARELGLEVGLYADIAVSVDSGGAEAWGNQDSYALGASIGAPPDEINLQGQAWGLPPLHPERLRAAAYEPFIAVLRANMRHAGAVRIDHVMGLARLFWVPKGGSAKDGAYVRYPFEDLLGVLALESERNRCMVIGEDLGTVPDEVRAGLQRTGVLSYRLLYFERSAGNDYIAPADYPVDALVAATTHDLPPLAGYWEGRDLRLRQALGLFPSEAVREAQIVARAQDRARLALVLEREGLVAPGSLDPVAQQDLPPAAARAVQLYLARSPARVLVVQLEDVLGLVEQPNVPGTTDEHPNWKRRLPVELERIADDPRFSALAAALSAERPRARVAGKPRVPPAARIPRATYRLQLNKTFTFADATALVPYLAELGVSHVYCSPYLRARPGSTHGYDIIDHGALNPEIGSAADLDRFVAALRERGMGHILDMVPNHVGVMGADNGWWLDVLEDGPASAHAHFFDIEWFPPSTDLAHKILVPVLGDHYGMVLERDELELRFEAASGSFSVWYHDHRFPVDPRDYAMLLERALSSIDRAATTEAVLTELATLAAAAGRLPARSETAGERALERRRGKEAVKQRLARLAAEGGAVTAALDGAARACAGAAGREALHELLERQAYRLAHWRVASDEINYRRFFDINDLAALRMEDETVFDATHRLALSLAADGKLDGLRIDHPDGLYDPAGYFERLQARYAHLSGYEFPAAGSARRALPFYVVIEKIAAGHEHVPQDWAVHGTTGYRFAAVVNGLFVDGAAREEMDRIYRSFVPDALSFQEEAHQGRRAILRTALASALTMLSTELLRIARADRSTRDYSLIMLRQALTEVIASFPVYRTYIGAGKPSDQDRRYIDWAVARARRRSRAADITIFDFVRRMLLAEKPPGASPELAALVLDFARKFQQLTAPVAAKGVEDTAFYRYNRLVSLNDVGSDPEMFGFPVTAFHGASAERAAHWPHTMLGTSTHDNKRAEDVRARINVISEFPSEWQTLVQRWARINRSRKRNVEDEPAPSPNDEYLLYQTLIGTFPADTAGGALAGYRSRIKEYMIKAVREAKVQSSWTAPNEDYEGAVTAFVEAILGEADSNLFLADLRAQHARFAWFGWLNGLSATLVKFASPGVPDIYQGTELPDLSLVDPDNRRPVDYDLRRRVLADLARVATGPEPAQAVRGFASSAQGRGRLWIIWRALQLRAEHPDLFKHGDYVALSVAGTRANNVVAFARRHDDYGLIAIAGRLWAGLGARVGEVPLGKRYWTDTVVDLAPLGEIEEPMDVLTMQPVRIANGSLQLADAFGNFPGALIFCRLSS
jgi:(1->4)-alpha-D-glucan 1-alpha-D-glucosylmutase